MRKIYFSESFMFLKIKTQHLNDVRVYILGRYPCCGERAFKFEPIKNPFVSFIQIEHIF